LRKLVSAGDLSVLMITHKFREVMAFCDDVTVLRRGRFAGSGTTVALDSAHLAEMMMGEARKERSVETTRSARGIPRLQIKNLCALGDNGLEVVNGVNLTVHEREIVGIAGVSGNGQREFVEVIAGQRSATAGEITVEYQRHLPTREMLRKHRFF